GFSLAMPLIAPQLWKTLDLNDSRILETVERARQSRIEMINQVKNAYYTLLLAEDSYRVIQESYDMARFTADLYAKQFSLGAASQYDVLRTEVAVKNVEPELTQATIAIKQARLQLLILMGMEQGPVIAATTTLADYEQSMYDDVLGINRDIAGNTDLRMLDIQTQQLRDALKVQKMSLYPTLSLAANYNWTSMNDGTPFKGLRWSPYSMVGLTLSIPIFEGGQRYSRIKQAEIQAGEMKWQRDNLVRSINMQTDLAIDNIEMNVKQIASCSESVRQAETAHNIMQQSFEIGAASYLDLRDSELALTRSRLAYYQAIYNYLVAGSDLELLLGNADTERYTGAAETVARP
ncbi:MAG: TolC family protein, partial [Paramuribaculum sp.]